MATSHSTSNSGIYVIKNTINGHFYIGQSVDLGRRWIDHRKNLRGNQHANPYLQNAWNKHGEKAFRFLVLEYCPAEKLDEREQQWLDKYACKNECYNLAVDATSPMRGRKASEETKRKLSASHKGKPHPNPPISEATRQKLREIQMGEGNNFYGRKHSEETKRKIGNANRGHKHTDETKRKISIAGKQITPEQRQKIADTHRGKPKSEQQRQKMSEAQKLRRKDEREQKDE